MKRMLVPSGPSQGPRVVMDSSGIRDVTATLTKTALDFTPASSYVILDRRMSNVFIGLFRSRFPQIKLATPLMMYLEECCSVKMAYTPDLEIVAREHGLSIERLRHFLVHNSVSILDEKLFVHPTRPPYKIDRKNPEGSLGQGLARMFPGVMFSKGHVKILLQALGTRNISCVDFETISQEARADKDYLQLFLSDNSIALIGQTPEPVRNNIKRSSDERQKLCDAFHVVFPTAMLNKNDIARLRQTWYSKRVSTDTIGYFASIYQLSPRLLAQFFMDQTYEIFVAGKNSKKGVTLVDPLSAFEK